MRWPGRSVQLKAKTTTTCRLWLAFQPGILFASAALALSAFGSAHAADLYPWRNHRAPFSFVFGSEIDTHQQTRLTRDGSLFGVFYIRFTGTQPKDHYPVATCDLACGAGQLLRG